MAILPNLGRIFLCHLGLFLFFYAAAPLAAPSAAAQKDSVHKSADAKRVKHKTKIPKLVLKDHPLVNRIWDVAAGRFVDRPALRDKLLQQSYILLGETHDNTDHHKFQAWVLQQLHEAGRDTVVAFEMISESQGKLLHDNKPVNAEQLVELLDREDNGWEYKNYYLELFDSVLRAGFAMIPANLDRQSVVNIVMQGQEQISSEFKTILENSKLSPEQHASLTKEIEESHCNMIDQTMVEGMIIGQRVRDVAMTLALTKKHAVATAVLIAGSGHVRRDRGVPFYLREQHKHATGQVAKISSVAWVGVEEDLKDVSAYAEHWGAQKLPFDFVWFTARADRPDPCEQFKQHMKKMNK